MSGANATPVYLNALGIVCALGAGVDEVARNLFAGKSDGIRNLENAVVTGEQLPFAAVEGALPGIPSHLRRYASRNFALALAAIEQIEPDIEAEIERHGADRVAVVMGTSTSGISEGEAAVRHAICAGILPPDFDFLQQEIGSVAESIAACFRLAAPAITVSTACSSSAKAFDVGRRLLRQDLADAVIVGGCDSRCGLTLNGFHALSALSRGRCNPFSVNRDGTVIGEGAAVFLMSRRPTGVLVAGIGESSDAHNITAPDPAGRGAIDAMRAALKDAGIAAEQLSYLNLHGTGTSLNDAMEGAAVRAVAGPQLPCSSSKGQVGHTLGAAGAVEAALCWLTLRHNPRRLLPPHVWDAAPDEAAQDLNLVTGRERLPDGAAGERAYLMSNSYAFGGSNIAIILGAQP